MSRELLATVRGALRGGSGCGWGAGLLLGHAGSSHVRALQAPLSWDIHRSGHSLQRPGLSLHLGVL